MTVLKEPETGSAAQGGPAPKPRGASPSFPRGLFRYIWRTGGRAQLLLAALAVVLFLLDLVPLELQRRIVNQALHQRVFATLLWLCAVYAVVVLLQGGLKLALNIFRSWVGESANRRFRLDTYDAALRSEEQADSQQEGVGLSIILAEVDTVGGFIGMSFSEPVLHGGVLLSVFGYLIYLQPWMGAVGLALFAPQMVFVPLIQRAINERTKDRINTMRELSVDIVKETADGVPHQEEDTYKAQVGRIFRLNMQIFRRKFTMNFLMNLLHHLGIVGILFIGGWLVVERRIEVGTVVAFISGLNKINDPWGDVVSYFQNMTNARVKYRLIANVLNGSPPSPGTLSKT